MRKFYLITVMCILSSTWCFAADFVPIVMTLTAPAEIEYQFDGTDATIPFTVSGTNAAVWLIINTKGQAANIVGIRNGFLGWHYVNKIDTTVYVSNRYERETGETSIVWDGNNQDGKAVAPGAYDYYLWAYDDKTSRYMASGYIRIGFGWESQFTHIMEVGEDGLPLTQPFIYGNVPWHQVAAEAAFPFYHGTHFKWVIGGDPTDVANYQTTFCAIYQGTRDYANEFSYGVNVFNPTDYNTFYHCSSNTASLTNTMLKWKWVSDGEAILDESWLGWDELTWEDRGNAIAVWSQKPSSYTDREYIYVQSPGLHQKEDEWNKLRCVSFEGEEIFDKMMHEWYYPDDPNPHGYINGAFHLLYSRGNNHWMLVSHTACLNEMINTTRLLEDVDDETDMIVFQNTNGDYWMDSAYEPDVEPAWYCLADDKTTSMRRDAIAIDRNGFNVIGTSYLGLVSFGVSTQDGTGIDYMSFADDTIGDDKNLKGSGLLVDTQSNYDGLYYGPAETTDRGGYGVNETWYCAFDSVHGIITNQPGGIAVEEEVQAAFAVAQNSPNPFNPTTSISFTLPGADHVTVDVYNVAGQKVDTLVNGFMETGKHSVVWDASGFSAGVYFYTVKSGDFSKTMKMTLLK